jgi:hypothetical protein
MLYCGDPYPEEEELVLSKISLGRKKERKKGMIS